MDPNQLTQKSQEALHDAQTKAVRYGHTEVDVEHLLLALLDQRGRPRRRACSRAPASTSTALHRRARAASSSAGRASPGRAASGKVYVTRAAQRGCSTRRATRPSG